MSNTFQPQDIVAMMKSGKNPQQIVMAILNKNAQSTNPMYANLLSLAKENKTQDIEQIARNLAKERGLDYDKEFGAFKQFLGLR